MKAFRVDVFLFCGEKSSSLSFFIFLTQTHDVVSDNQQRLA